MSPLHSSRRPAAVMAVNHVNMFAMWRVGRFPTVLLAISLASAISCPAAWASPEGESIQQYGQAPAWGSCEQFIGDTTSIPTAQCGTVAVPVDWNNAAKPEGAQAQLAVIRIPASGEKIGVLVVNPGGPGASAVDTVATMGGSLAGSDIMRRFDLVGIDPRGVGHSTPELRCRTDDEFDAFRREPMADYSPDGVAHIEALYTQFAGECAQKMGTEFLANVGTASSAQDMDVVRAALGENQINYLGFSYGTELGAAYAERYPDRVRAMVRSPTASARWRASKPLSTTTRRTAHSRQAARSAPTRRSSSTAFTRSSTRWWRTRPERRIRAA